MQLVFCIKLILTPADLKLALKVEDKSPLKSQLDLQDPNMTLYSSCMMKLHLQSIFLSTETLLM